MSTPYTVEHLRDGGNVSNGSISSRHRTLEGAVRALDDQTPCTHLGVFCRGERVRWRLADGQRTDNYHADLASTEEEPCG